MQSVSRKLVIGCAFLFSVRHEKWDRHSIQSMSNRGKHKFAHGTRLGVQRSHYKRLAVLPFDAVIDQGLWENLVVNWCSGGASGPKSRTTTMIDGESTAASSADCHT